VADAAPAAAWKRILLKVSGEGFARPGDTALDVERVKLLAHQLIALHREGFQVACVIGGGNIVRGARVEGLGIDRATGDYMGMLATVINGLALCDALEGFGVPTRVMSAIDVHKVCEPFIRRRALRHMEKGRVVVLVGGLGNPFFTTDTAAAQRAVELGCHALFKATMVDGIYDKDPRKHQDAVRLPALTFQQVMDQRLQVMDQTAFALCREQNLPIIVFDMDAPDGLLRAARGEKIGTVVRN
jgi:uridylate kinase